MIISFPTHLNSHGEVIHLSDKQERRNLRGKEWDNCFFRQILSHLVKLYWLQTIGTQMTCNVPCFKYFWTPSFRQKFTTAYLNLIYVYVHICICTCVHVCVYIYIEWHPKSHLFFSDLGNMGRKKNHRGIFISRLAFWMLLYFQATKKNLYFLRGRAILSK